MTGRGNKKYWTRSSLSSLFRQFCLIIHNFLSDAIMVLELNVFKREAELFN